MPFAGQREQAAHDISLRVIHHDLSALTVEPAGQPEFDRFAVSQAVVARPYRLRRAAQLALTLAPFLALSSFPRCARRMAGRNTPGFWRKFSAVIPWRLCSVTTVTPWARMSPMNVTAVSQSCRDSRSTSSIRRKSPGWMAASKRPSSPLRFLPWKALTPLSRYGSTSCRSCSLQYASASWL